MEPRLRPLVKEKDERLDILKQVYCETHRTVKRACRRDW